MRLIRAQAKKDLESKKKEAYHQEDLHELNQWESWSQGGKVRKVRYVYGTFGTYFCTEKIFRYVKNGPFVNNPKKVEISYTY